MNILLKYLKENISNSEINQLTLEGFKFPNNFSIDNLKEHLKLGKFPSKELEEFCFGIYETPIKEIEKLNPYLKSAIYAVFLYSYFKKGGCIDNLDEIYLYHFLKAASRLKTSYIKSFLVELKQNTKASTHFLELAIVLLSCKNLNCKNLKEDFLNEFKNNLGTIYQDFDIRWKRLIKTCNNEEIKRCVENLLNEAKRLQHLFYN